MRPLLLLFFLCTCVPAQSQTSALATDFFVDPVGRSYLLLADGSLVADNPLGQNRFAFFDSSLGRPNAVDVSNPFAILLHYADYGEVVLLDRTLSEIRRLDLFAIAGVEQPTVLARATDNGIWLFDAWDYRLKLLDERSTVALRSNDLRQELKEFTAPTAIYVHQNLVMLHYAEQQRLAVLTNYGRFVRWVDLPAANRFGWLDGRLAGSDDQESWVFDLRQDKVARTQVPWKVDERWLPGQNGWYRLVENKQVVWLEENK